jgi:hypothetical protein
VVSNYNSKNEDKTILLNSLNNNTIEFGTYRPKDSRFISLGRKIKILGPPEAVKITQYGEEVISDLIKLLQDEERDWAANVILSSITGRDASIVSVFADNYEKWQKTQKKNDINYWKNKLAEDFTKRS